ncbi:M16 family metallopeptidase [Mangrovicoccus algicola]|uniref:Insulinase family protein n=1 Tax=Mangrovicoccus algicola TaxID=2771008 RepID=A0A8J7CX37_9RHOB|nr:pitrilysin family protein [Mangrovicoccus algicola]MBE3640124.1 insulinase family protein [Mangrovicoccus algicola]
MTKASLFRAVWPLAFTLAAAAPAVAQEVTSFTLDNGLQVVVIEDHRAPAVTHMMWYKVGSADEPPGRNGIAHYLEHLMFKGTEILEPGEFSRVVAQHGGNDNAFTSYDQTAYFQHVAADQLGLMMKMEASRMTGLKLTEDVVTPELGVIIEERNQRTDSSPGALFGEQRRAAQFLRHPYGNPIIGWPGEMSTLTLEDAVSFYHDHYAPNNAVLVVAGDVTPDAVRSLAEENYGGLPANPGIAERVRPSEPPQLAARHLSFEDPRVAQPYLTRSYLAPERDPGAQETAAALALLADLLGEDPNSSVLGRSLQFDRQVAIYTGAYYDATSLDDTTFSLTVVPAPGVTLEAAEAALDETLAGFLDSPIDAARLDRLKRQYRAAQIYRRDSADSVARDYGQALTSGLTVEDVAAWPDIVQSVTADQILAAAREVFDPAKSVTGYLSPPPGAAPAAAGEPPVTDSSDEVSR